MTTSFLPVCVVDDAPDVHASLCSALEAAHIESYHFNSAEELLASEARFQAGCIVIDVRLPGMTGLELQAELRREGLDAPIVMMSGQATVEQVIAAYQNGLHAFFEKPFDCPRLLACVQDLLSQEHERRHQSAARREREQSLSRRELEVFDLLMAGKTAKTIARELGISLSTAEKHRTRVLSKMACDSVVDLLRQAFAGSDRDARAHTSSSMHAHPYPAAPQFLRTRPRPGGSAGARKLCPHPLS